MSATAPRRGIWWAKRDLRLADNDALLAALDACDAVLVLYVVEPSLARAEDVSALQYHAWGQATDALRASVEAIGGAFHLAVGEVVDVLDGLRADDGFDALYAHEETGADVTHARDRAVRAWCRRSEVPFVELPQSGVIRGLKDRDTRQPIIRARLVETAPRPAPTRLPAWRPTRASAPWPGWSDVSGRPWPDEIRTDLLQPVTERDGRATLDSFLGARGIEYSGGISSPNSAFDAGSRLSAHIAWGTTSLRTIHHDTAARMAAAKASDALEERRWTKSLRAFGARLHWHDHFSQRLESAPEMEHEALNEAHRALDYPDDPALLAAWCEGRTGHPMVDAAVRCLRATGYMNFRMRAMLASVACYGLELSWRSIQYPYARMFRDYEPGIHYAQVQMQAGVVGINALRVYSPAKQLLDQDPDAVFVRRWVPELEGLDAKAIRAYETTRLDDYPAPVTDVREGAARAKSRIHAIRRTPEGRAAAKKVLELHGSRLPPSAREGTPHRGRRAGAKKAASKKAVSKTAPKRAVSKKTASKRASSARAGSKRPDDGRGA